MARRGLSAAYIIMVGGDYIHARLFMPAPFAACAPVAVIPATRRYLPSALIVPWAIVCAVSLRPPEVTGPFLSADRPFVMPTNTSEHITLEGGG
jgi:arabinofuranosyltransferase